jgi:hypothetical protein
MDDNNDTKIWFLFTFGPLHIKYLERAETEEILNGYNWAEATKLPEEQFTVYLFSILERIFMPCNYS